LRCRFNHNDWSFTVTAMPNSSSPTGWSYNVAASENTTDTGGAPGFDPPMAPWGNYSYPVVVTYINESASTTTQPADALPIAQP